MYQIETIQGDVTKVRTDCIVNAANTWLHGGGGVDGAIHRAAGPVLGDACAEYVREHGLLPTGQVMHTGGGHIPVKGIIHAVGPVYREHLPDESDRLLQACYRNALVLAESLQYGSIAFPNISTGVYGFPKDRAAEVVCSGLHTWQTENWTFVRRVILVCFDDVNLAFYQKSCS